MYLSSVISLSSVCLALVVLGCTPNVPPPNPITGMSMDGGPSDGPSKGKGKGTRPGGKGKPTGGEQATGPNWKKVAELKLEGTMLRTTVQTTAKCCAGAEIHYKRSPARFYLAADDESLGRNGYLLWLDEKDQVVLSRQTEPGVYGEDVYRSKTPAKRQDGRVHLDCPTELLPQVATYIWAGSPTLSSVEGKVLEDGSPEEGIPAFLLLPKVKKAKEAKTPP